MRRGIAVLLTSLGLVPTVAAALADRVSAPTKATLLSHDGAVVQAPAIGIINTAEGTWTFGAAARPGGDHPVLLNGSANDRNCALASTMRLTMPNRSKVLRARRSIRVTITT